MLFHETDKGVAYFCLVFLPVTHSFIHAFILSLFWEEGELLPQGTDFCVRISFSV